jgi:hypothetical protein
MDAENKGSNKKPIKIDKNGRRYLEVEVTGYFDQSIGKYVKYDSKLLKRIYIN